MPDGTPSDEELREWWKGTHWSDPLPSDLGSLRLAFDAGRASTVPTPTRDEIRDSLMPVVNEAISEPSIVGDWLADDLADAVLGLFGNNGNEDGK